MSCNEICAAQGTMQLKSDTGTRARTNVHTHTHTTAAYLLKDRFVVVHVVHPDDNLRCGRQGLRATRGVVISRRDVEDILHSLEARGGAGAQPDQSCKDQSHSSSDLAPAGPVRAGSLYSFRHSSNKC